MSLYGFHTAAFTIDAASGFRPEYGLDKGFHRMEISQAPRNTPDGRGLKSNTVVQEEGDGASALPLQQWLEKRSTKKPVFVMHHNRTAHFPFLISPHHIEKDSTGMSKLLWEVGTHKHKRKPMPGSMGGSKTKGVVQNQNNPMQTLVNEKGDEAIDVFRMHYRAAVQRMDKDIGVIIETQKKRNRLDKTIWVLVADHGESLNDHNELLHGAQFYNSVINVPLIVKIPGLPGFSRPIPALVSHVDIMPTILELVGAVAPATIDGTSMMPLMRKEKEKIRHIALSEGGVAIPKGEMPGAVIALPWTLLFQEGGCYGSSSQALPRNPGQTTSRCLYNLIEDPEQEELISRQDQSIIRRLESTWWSFQKSRKQALQMNLDPSFVRELQRTGYDFRTSEED